MMNSTSLESQNSWWIDGRIPEVARQSVPRRLAPSVVAGLSQKRATLLLGPRRVGKTVLVHQVVGRLLEAGAPARSIVYASGDDPLLGPAAERLELLLAFAADQLRESPRQPVYLLVDEVHAIPDWPLWVKRTIDRQQPIVWLLTSSAGSILHKGSRESLAGRARDVPLLPFSLAEVAALVRSPAAAVLAGAADVWARYGVGALTGERADALRGISREALGLGDELEHLCRRYLREGGFPEYLTEKAVRPRDYFWQTLVERVLYVDVPAVARVRHPLVLRELCLRLLSQGPRLINIERLGSELGVTHVTIGEYLGIIERTMLDFVLPRYAPSLAARQRGTKKSVPVDPGLVVALSGWDVAGPQRTTHEGRLAEVVVHAWLRRHTTDHDIMHWRQRDGVEVDFVLAAPGNPLLPIEVKWGGGDGARHRGLAAFARTYGSNESLVITRGTLDLDSSPRRIPLWMLA